jgi:AcrR family transcriptional regulator
VSGSKAGLLTAFATAGYQLLAESVISELAASQAADGAEELAAIGRGYVRFAVGHPAHFEVMFRLDALNPANNEFAAASEMAYELLTATIERCRAAGRLQGRSPEVVAVSAWSLVHGLSALWISGRLSERITEQDPQRLAGAVSDLFVSTVLPPQSARSAYSGM